MGFFHANEALALDVSQKTKKAILPYSKMAFCIF
jgi:hypothetical protein